MSTIDNPVAIDHLSDQLDALRAIGQRIDELEDMRDKIKATILGVVGEHDAGTVAGRPVVKRTVYTQRRLSTTLVRKRFTDDELAECYNDVTSTRVTWT